MGVLADRRRVDRVELEVLGQEVVDVFAEVGHVILAAVAEVGVRFGAARV
jgi:hypothetical protein